MKKRTYRAQEVKSVDLERLVERTPSRVIFAVDVAKETMYAALMKPSEEVLATVKWNHLRESREVVDRLRRLLVVSVEVVMEPSGTYGDSLRWLCYEAHLPVYRVKPKQVNDLREVYDGVPSSHDGKSAAMVGWLHLLGRSELWEPRSESRRALAAAVQTNRRCDRSFRQVQNSLEAELARYWPELPEELALDSVTLLELLAAYGGPAGVAAAPQEARQLMARVGGVKLDRAKIDRVIASAARTVGVPMVEAEQEALRQLAVEGRYQQKAKKRSKKEVEALSESSASQPLGQVVGAVTAAVLEVKLGQPAEYPSPRSYVKAAGLNLKVRSSGKRKGQLAITKRGSGLVRQYLYLAALRWIKDDEVARAWYEKKIHRDGGRQKGQAIVALMRKLLAGLWWVGKGRAFDVTRLFDVSKLEALA